MATAKKNLASFRPRIVWDGDQAKVIGFEFRYGSHEETVDLAEFGRTYQSDVKAFGECVAIAVLESPSADEEVIELNQSAVLQRRERSYNDRLNRGSDVANAWRKLFGFRALTSDEAATLGVDIGTYLKAPNDIEIAIDKDNDPLRRSNSTLYSTPLSYVFEKKKSRVRPRRQLFDETASPLGLTVLDADGNEMSGCDEAELGEAIRRSLASLPAGASSMIEPKHMQRQSSFPDCQDAYRELLVDISEKRIEPERVMLVQYSGFNSQHLVKECLRWANSIRVYTVDEATAEEKQRDRIEAARNAMLMDYRHDRGGRELEFSIHTYPSLLAGPRIVWIEGQAVVISSYRTQPQREESTILGHADPAMYITRDDVDFSRYEEFAREIVQDLHAESLAVFDGSAEKEPAQ